MDENEILLSQEAYDEFVRRTLEPPKDLPKLRRLLQQPTVFEVDWMRDPKRIAPILAELAYLWQMNPDWRLGQLVSNAARVTGWPALDVFYIEDEKVLEGLEALRVAGVGD